MILNKCDFVISRISISFHSFSDSLTRCDIAWYVIRTEGVGLFSSQNDKLWQPMKVKNWNHLLNPPTNPPTKFDDLWKLMVLYERAKIFKFCKCGFIATLKIILKAYEDLWLRMKAFLKRRGWDSNPRCPCRHASFQD